MTDTADIANQQKVNGEVEGANGGLSQPTDAKVVADAEAKPAAHPAEAKTATRGEVATANGELVKATDGEAVAEAESNGAKTEDKEDAIDKLSKPKDSTADSAPEKKDDYKPISAHDRHDRGRGGRGRGRGRNYNNNRSENIKTRFEEQPESNDPDEIRRQVEFYFSDSNLPIDNYLLEKTGGSKNKPVSLKIIHNFKRMRHFQPYSAVRAAVAESEFLNLNEDDEITRKTPLDDKFTDDSQANRALVHTSSMGRSIYAKGFGSETKTTHLDIEAFFAPYGPTKSVRLRRSEDGLFKGSVFVEFEDEEQQVQFLELDPKPQWQESKDLEIMSKQEYVDMKHQGIIDGDVKPKSQGQNFSGGDRRDRRGSGGRDWIPQDEWNKRRDRDQRDDRGGRGRGGRGRGCRGRGDRGGRGGRGGYRDRDEDRQDRPRRRRSRSPDDRDEALRKSTKEDGASDAQAKAARELGTETADIAVGAEAPSHAKEHGDGFKEANADATVGAESKKRSLEDDGGAATGAAKKQKEDVATNA